MNHTCWFTDEQAADPAFTGGKGASLSKLAAGGFPIPPGFCVTTIAYRRFLQVTGLSPVIDNMLGKLNFDDPEDLAKKSASIRELIEQQPIPDEIALEIQECYASLGAQQDRLNVERTTVAVRSSATAEDLPGASFAGQQDTYLNISGRHNVLEHVRRCWASLWTARAVTYRQRKGFAHQKVAIAVVVQVMINSEVSGVLFTANPINGHAKECVINASWGLGESIVSGTVTPDTYIVDKRDGRILRQEIAGKERQTLTATEHGLQETEVSQSERYQSSLGPEDIARLTALGERIEAHYGAPQDIEWALAGSSWHILQARPITTFREERADEHDQATYSRAMFVEIFHHGLSPSFLSVVCELLAGMLKTAFHTLGFRRQPEIRPIGAYYSQPYLSVSYIEEALRDVDPRVKRRLVDKFSNIFSAEESDHALSLTQITIFLRLIRFTRHFRRTLPSLLNAYHQELEQLGKLPLNGTSTGDLLSRVRTICFTGAAPLLNNDFLVIASISIFRSILIRLLRRDFGDRSEELLNALLSGVSGNVVMETNRLIWELAGTAHRSTQVADLILDTPPDEVLAVLEELPRAQPFLGQLDELLAVCGHREQFFDILFPTWGEDPVPVLSFVCSYLQSESWDNPSQREAALLLRRVATTADVRRVMNGRFSGKFISWPLFSQLLRQTQWLARQRDTMHFEWTRLFPQVRRIELEVGRRWQLQGLIDQPHDIFFLTLDEQEALARRPQPSHDRIEERRAQYRANFEGPWPTIISGQSEFADRQSAAPNAQQSAHGLLTGISGSPGYAAGPARIISGPQDFARLRDGDILVARMTNPSWTPLFAIAGGIITEVGGILSHGAIVAREYGVPAVMSLSGATSLFTDGERIVVDGCRGLVHREASIAHKIA